MVGCKNVVKICVMVSVLASIILIYAVTPPNYVCQPNSGQSCNKSSGSGSSSSSSTAGACADSVVQEFLKGNNPFANQQLPPRCEARLRKFREWKNKCDIAKKCLSNQENALKKDIEDLKKAVEALESDARLKEILDLQKIESGLKTCLANCKTPEEQCKAYVTAHLDDVIGCTSRNIWKKDVCKTICKICPEGKYAWCPRKCRVDLDCYFFRAHCVEGFCKSVDIRDDDDNFEGGWSPWPPYSPPGIGR